ncbi:hypothetical protein KORDIASMS9_03422 [Kordia sp. SMS9]|uniref:hypothetical protein n=1 Tax=Kordia sp. SMS9 TaxID=2282170 RepID=UPI000E0DEC54|nr:hypothetical protein [Kordia sp. SMS9]AXG71167.1 hypothetical protein KORDIASMS9_03422 [Kordia sp. SMS9]
MKRKKHIGLKLHKYKVSNLTLLHNKAGANSADPTLSETDTTVTTNPNNTTTVQPTEETFCYSDCNDCGTNGGTTKAPPPTEFETCICQPPGLG